MEGSCTNLFKHLPEKGLSPVNVFLAKIYTIKGTETQFLLQMLPVQGKRSYSHSVWFRSYL